MAKKIQKPSIPANPSSSQLTPLQKKMHKKLAGAKFRWINEQLYTTDSSHAVKLFKEKPEMFRIVSYISWLEIRSNWILPQYHEGFRSQVEEWPTNPVDVLIRYLRTKGPETVVADMGCGDGKIAQELHKILEIHSFDLVAPNKFITACDIAHVPLKAGSVDIVIFCLSLMGVNFMDFLQEAFRILKDGYASLNNHACRK